MRKTIINCKGKCYTITEADRNRKLFNDINNEIIMHPALYQSATKNYFTNPKNL